jgi:antitoxin (DNA-binding transcriptional repressor) of toxin-antitoxin stability system
MTTVTLEEAQNRLPELIANLRPGDEVLITKDAAAVAKLLPQASPAGQPRQPGSMVGKLHILQEDEDHLRDFQEYMS